MQKAQVATTSGSDSPEDGSPDVTRPDELGMLAQPGGHGLMEPGRLHLGSQRNAAGANGGRRTRDVQSFESEPEISGDSAPEASEEERSQRPAQERPAKKKAPRRKRPRLVPPHSRTSRFRGVYWEPKGSKWYSSISSNHKQIHLGSFNTEEEAAQAFDQEAIRLRGANTFTNFPSNTYLNGKVEKDDITAQPQKRPHNQSRRKVVPKVKAKPPDMLLQEKDDSAANALLSLGSALQPSADAPVAPPRRIIAPPITLRGQKRKRAGGLAAKFRPRLDGAGRARSKYTGVYQQSRGSGWFASICVDKSMRYLGTFATEEEAARAFDQEAIRLRGLGIELNLPHEAEAFMKQLKEEEREAAAKGEAPAWKLGPRPQVSAGPDFEAGTSCHVGLAESRSDDEQPFYLQREVSEEPGVSRSKQCLQPPPQHMQDFVRMEGGVARPFLKGSESSSDGEESEDMELPTWNGRRLRSEVRLSKSATRKRASAFQPPKNQVLRPKAVPAFTSGVSPAIRDLTGSPGVPKPSLAQSSYLSLLAPGAGQIPVGFNQPSQNHSQSQGLFANPAFSQPYYPSYHSLRRPSQQPLSPFLPENLPPRGFNPPGLPTSLGGLPSAQGIHVPVPSMAQGPYHLRPLNGVPSFGSSGASFAPTSSQTPTSYAIYIRNPPSALGPGAQSWGLPSHPAIPSQGNSSQQPSKAGSAFRSQGSDAQSGIRGPTAEAPITYPQHGLGSLGNVQTSATGALSRPVFQQPALSHQFPAQQGLPAQLSQLSQHLMQQARLNAHSGAAPPAQGFSSQQVSRRSEDPELSVQDMLKASKQTAAPESSSPRQPHTGAIADLAEASAAAETDPEGSNSHHGTARALKSGSKQLPSATLGRSGHATHIQAPRHETNSTLQDPMGDASQGNKGGSLDEVEKQAQADAPLSKPSVHQISGTIPSEEASRALQRPLEPAQSKEGLQAKAVPIRHSVLATDAWLSTPGSDQMPAEEGQRSENNIVPILIQ